MANPLGEFEVLMLLGVLRLGDEATPAAVRTEIELRAKRAVQRGAIYVTLDRLETKRLLTSRLTDADCAGARQRRIYKVTTRGLHALRRAIREVERMRRVEVAVARALAVRSTTESRLLRAIGWMVRRLAPANRAEAILF